MQPSSGQATVGSLAEEDATASAEVVEESLFPYDFTKLNRHGLRIDPHSYCFYRICMLIAFTALFTLLLLYGPELKYVLP